MDYITKSEQNKPDFFYSSGTDSSIEKERDIEAGINRYLSHVQNVPNFINTFPNQILFLVEPVSARHRLVQDFQFQKIKYEEYLPESIDKLDDIFHSSINYLLRLKPSKIKCFLLDSRSIFFELLSQCGLSINFEVYYEDTPASAIFSVYNDDNLISQDSGDLIEMYDELSEILDLNQLNSTASESQESSTSFTWFNCPTIP